MALALVERAASFAVEALAERFPELVDAACTLSEAGGDESARVEALEEMPGG